MEIRIYKPERIANTLNDVLDDLPKWQLSADIPHIKMLSRCYQTMRKVEESTLPIDYSDYPVIILSELKDGPSEGFQWHLYRSLFLWELELCDTAGVV